MRLNRALEIFEYSKAMLTCDMSIRRDPEHQDVSPDYYGKDAEDLYYAIVCVERYIKNSIPIEQLLSILPKYDDYIHTTTYPYNETTEDIYSKGYKDGWEACLKAIKEELDYWEKENADTD